MIDVNDFFNELTLNEICFYTGVPDSLLKNICAFISDHSNAKNHIIAANEGGAISLGVGYYLATGKIPLVYMQNSGIGNAINPLLSLADKEVYATPMLLMIGWRGEPNVKDEPQHIKQGQVTLDLLRSMNIPYYIIDANTDYKTTIEEASLKANSLSAPVAIVIRKNTFSPYKLESIQKEETSLSRENALETVLKSLNPNDIIVSTTGMLSRELFEMREKMGQNHNADFLTVGSMGHASQIALGIALQKPNRRVFCFDGDGAIIMHAGAMGIIGSCAPSNFYHILFNNAAHDSVGGQPTIGNFIDFQAYAKANQYVVSAKATTKAEINEHLSSYKHLKGPCFLEIKVAKGSRNDLGRPTSSPLENKNAFMNFLTE